MPGCGSPWYLPYMEIEGGNMQVLGRFITYFRLLSETYYKLRGEHSPDAWGILINGIIEGFFEPDPASSGGTASGYSCRSAAPEMETLSGFSSSVGLPL